MAMKALWVGCIAFLVGCAAMGAQPPAGSVKAQAQASGAVSSVTAPVWKPGDEWAFRWESPQGKGTFVWMVSREEIVDSVAYYVVMAGREREMYARKADLAFYLEKVRGEVERRYVPPQLLYVWPLTVGKTWEETYTYERPLDRQTSEFVLRCQVAAEEPMTVPAGTFRAFKIVCRNPRMGSIIAEIWYAPDVKQAIRRREQLVYGFREQELISFKID